MVKKVSSAILKREAALGREATTAKEITTVDDVKTQEFVPAPSKLRQPVVDEINKQILIIDSDDSSDEDLIPPPTEKTAAIRRRNACIRVDSKDRTETPHTSSSPAPSTMPPSPRAQTLNITLRKAIARKADAVFKPEITNVVDTGFRGFRSKKDHEWFEIWFSKRTVMVERPIEVLKKGIPSFSG